MILQSALDGIGKGLLQPIVGMNHLLFCLIAALVLFTLRKKPQEIGLYLFALIPGLAVQWNWAVPSVLINVVVALTVAFVMVQHWIYEKLAAWTVPMLLLAGFFHGLSFAEAAAGSSLDGFLAYGIAAILVQGLIMYGFGAVCRRLSIKAPDGYESLENLLSAVGAGVALAYFFLAF